jgi:hypothetical protein
MSPVSITCRLLQHAFVRPCLGTELPLHVTESSSGSGETGAQAPHQRSVDASGPGDTTPGSSTTRGESHAGPEGRRPHCGATKKVTGGSSPGVVRHPGCPRLCTAGCGFRPGLARRSPHSWSIRPLRGLPGGRLRPGTPLPPQSADRRRGRCGSVPAGTGRPPGQPLRRRRAHSSEEILPWRPRPTHRRCTERGAGNCAPSRNGPFDGNGPRGLDVPRQGRGVPQGFAWEVTPSATGARRTSRRQRALGAGRAPQGPSEIRPGRPRDGSGVQGGRA